MEIGWLEDFLELSSTRVFSKAAHARNLSQPAFTRRIRKLSSWVGADLFDRSIHPVGLTRAGEEFQSTARQTVSALSGAREDMRRCSPERNDVIRIATQQTIATSFVPFWLKSVSRTNGAQRTRLTVESYSDCVEALLTGAVDFMLCYDHPPEIQTAGGPPPLSVMLAEDRLVAVSGVDSRGHAVFDFARDGTLPLWGYPPESFLGRLSRIAMARTRIADRLEMRCENPVPEIQIAACIDGQGIAWLPLLSVQKLLEDGKLLRISDRSTERKMSISLYRSVERSSPAIECFWTSARARAAFPGNAGA